jgi:predicted transcriptional regulator of viral defense system
MKKGVQQVSQRYVDFCDEPPVDVAIGQLAERQHGVVSLAQLQSLGLGKAAVSRRAKTGRLTRIHRAVYAVGHARLTGHGRSMAAVLAYGPGALTSYRTAGRLHGVRQDNRARIDVTVPSASARSRPGIDVHRTTTLEPSDITTVDGIPCTSVARTLVDLADVIDRRGVERAVNQAEVLQTFDLRAVHEVLARAAGRRGASVLRGVLDTYEGPTITRRELEERFLALCRSASLPSPALNAWIVLDDGTAYQVDFLWREQGLIVETDGWASHGTRQAFENDRRRDRRLRLAEYEVVRFTWRDVMYEPSEVEATLRGLLALALR